jgi:hypothetical protein
MNLVYRHKSGGELWQGDAQDVQTLATNHDSRIKTIGLFAIEFQPDFQSGCYEVLKHGFDDNRFMMEPEALEVAKFADSVSDKLSSRLRAGRGVLSSCAMGLNRSGLMTALTLMKTADVGPDEAIRLVRMARGPDALHNPVFVSIIKWMKDKKGNLATWTKWKSDGDDLLRGAQAARLTTEEIRAFVRDYLKRGGTSGAPGSKT